MKRIVCKKSLMVMVVVALFSFSAYAQADPDENEDGENELLNPTPINDYILPMLVVGVASGYYLIKKKSKIHV